MFESNNQLDETNAGLEFIEIPALDTPWTFSVSCEDGIWSIHFSRCNIHLLQEECTRIYPECRIQDAVLKELDHLPGTPKQWFDTQEAIPKDVDLLMAPQDALTRTNARFGFVQMDALHAIVYAKELADLFSLWTAWLLQRFPAKVDLHRSPSMSLGYANFTFMAASHGSME